MLLLSLISKLACVETNKYSTSMFSITTY